MHLKYLKKKEKLILIIGMEIYRLRHLIQAKPLFKLLKVSKSRIGVVNTTIQAWSIKMINLMDEEELSLQIIFGSSMDNGKMEFHMDTLE